MLLFPCLFPPSSLVDETLFLVKNKITYGLFLVSVFQGEIYYYFYLEGSESSYQQSLFALTEARRTPRTLCFLLMDCRIGWSEAH